MINTQQWPNILHMGLMNDCMSRLNLEWSDANPCPPLLQPYLSALAAARTDENGHKAVSPADRVDVEQSYELVPIAEG